MAMMVELPDEMVQRWLNGDGLDTDDEIILTAIYRAKKEQ